MMVGNNVSHSNRKTKRRFLPNLIVKRFYLPTEDRWISLKISTNALRTINKLGIEEVIRRSRANGFEVKGALTSDSKI